MADDWMNEHAETSPIKIRRWARSPATEKQRKLQKLNFLDQMSLYEAMCRITFKSNSARDPRPQPGERQTSRGSMSDWLYLIGSFCFVAGTIINMVQR